MTATPLAFDLARRHQADLLAEAARARITAEAASPLAGSRLAVLAPLVLGLVLALLLTLLAPGEAGAMPRRY